MSYQTFTYDLSTQVGQIRLEIGDTQQGGGVRPNGSNYADEEIAHFLAEEAGHTGRATARACEALARDWARTAGSQRLGPRSHERLQADAFDRQAQALRKIHGHAPGTTGQGGFNAKLGVA